jgi:hypothetical protein
VVAPGKPHRSAAQEESSIAMTTDEATYEELVTALRRCAGKLKVEYDRRQPDADDTECWAEAEHAFAVLARVPERSYGQPAGSFGAWEEATR